MAEKVKVSREIAEAIEELYVEYGGKTPDRIEVITYDIIRVIEMRKVFGSMRLQDVIKAISDGYEIEQTPAESVKEYYDSWNKPVDGIYSSNWSSEQTAIIGTLNRLNIKIKGVNTC